jgi:hypothetical protein
MNADHLRSLIEIAHGADPEVMRRAQELAELRGLVIRRESVDGACPLVLLDPSTNEWHVIAPDWDAMLVTVLGEYAPGVEWPSST